jgi:MFS superfamily sulfate permease-like transporter
MDAGAASSLFGIIASVTILLFIYFGTSLLIFVPKCTVACVIVVALAHLLSPSFPREAWSMGVNGRQDLLLFLFSFTVQTACGLELGIQISVVVNSLVTLAGQVAPRFETEKLNIEGGDVGVGVVATAGSESGVLLFRFPETIDYLCAGRFRKQILAGVDSDHAARLAKKRRGSIYDENKDNFMALASESLLSPEAPSMNDGGLLNTNNWSAGHVLFECSALKHLDMTGLHVLGEILVQLQRCLISFGFVCPAKHVAEMLQELIVRLNHEHPSDKPMPFTCYDSTHQAYEALAPTTASKKRSSSSMVARRKSEMKSSARV